MTDTLDVLRKAGKKLARIDAQRAVAMDELRAAIRAADAEGGHSRSELVRVAGVAKQTVYDALRPVDAAAEATSDGAK